MVLCDVEEFSYREIADIMECPVGTVMSRLHRGRRLLQVALREQALRCGIVRAEPGLPGTDELDELAARRLPERASDKNAQVLQLPRRPAQGSQGLVAKKA